MKHSYLIENWSGFSQYTFKSVVGKVIKSINFGIEWKVIRALRDHLLFQFLIVALSASIFSLHSIKQKLKQKIADFIFFSWIFKIFQNSTFFGDTILKFWAFINLPWGHVRTHTKFGPHRFSSFDVYWIQTDWQTNKQTPRQAKYIYVN